MDLFKDCPCNLKCNPDCPANDEKQLQNIIQHHRASPLSRLRTGATATTKLEAAIVKAAENSNPEIPNSKIFTSPDACRREARPPWVQAAPLPLCSGKISIT